MIFLPDTLSLFLKEEPRPYYLMEMTVNYSVFRSLELLLPGFRL
jgi:hypothetical protein